MSLLPRGVGPKRPVRGVHVPLPRLRAAALDTRKPRTGRGFRPSATACDRHRRRIAEAEGPRVTLVRGQLGARRAFLAFGVEDEGLHRQAVDPGVDAALEGADRAARDAFDGLTELADGRVLKGHPGVAQALVLAQLDEVALGGRER